MQIKQMWASGPYRQWSEKRETASQVAAATGGFLGMYVCEDGMHDCHGVYGVKTGNPERVAWLCSEHRNALKPKREQSEGLRRYQEAR